jgi:hypothetical protein
MMTPQKTMLYHVTIPQLKDYLARKGWIERPFGRDTTLKFAPPSEGEFCNIFIPAYAELIDYNRVVEIAIDCIAAVEDRSFYDTLSDILPRTLVELIELRQLISDCARLISKYGDDFALSQSLTSLKSREHNLLKRLQEE